MSKWNSQRSGRTEAFLERHPVFRTDEFHAVCCADVTPGSRANLLNYFVRSGRIVPVRRGIYAVVPKGVSSHGFRPNRYLVAACLRTDSVLSHHTALEVLGQAHAMSRTLYEYTAGAPARTTWQGYEFRMLACPLARAAPEKRTVGVVRREIDGLTVNVTGPERTLIDCMAKLQYAGGVEEAVVSLRGFPVFKLDLVEACLKILNNARLFATVGAFLDQEARRLFVPDDFLARLAARRPKGRTYIQRSERGGVYLKRWNLLVPTIFLRREDAVEI